MSHIRTTSRRAGRRPFVRWQSSMGESSMSDVEASFDPSSMQFPPEMWASAPEVPAIGAVVLERATARGLNLTPEQKWIAIGLLLLGLYVAYELGRRSAPTPTEARRRASTDRIAQDLQERLEKNGMGTPAVHRFLEEISRG